MSRLIKLDGGDSRASVRALSQAFADEQAPTLEAEPMVPQKDLAAAQVAIGQRDALIEWLRAESLQSQKDAEATGREAGRREADHAISRRLAMISAGVEEALVRFYDRLQHLERLAPALAMAGLGKVLSEPEHYAELVRATIEHHLRALESTAVVSVQVSSDDFPPPAGVAALSAPDGRPPVDVRASDQLASGACRIELKLGGYDLGIDEQWRRLSEALGALATQGTPP